MTTRIYASVVGKPKADVVETKQTDTVMDVDQASIDDLILLKRPPILRELELLNINLLRRDQLDVFETNYVQALACVKEYTRIVPRTVPWPYDKKEGNQETTNTLEVLMTTFKMENYGVMTTRVAGWFATILSGLYQFDAAHEYTVRNSKIVAVPHSTEQMRSRLSESMKRLVGEYGLDFCDLSRKFELGRILMYVNLGMFELFVKHFQSLKAPSFNTWFDQFGRSMDPQIEADRLNPWKVGVTIQLVEFLLLPTVHVVLDYILDSNYIYIQPEATLPGSFAFLCPFCGIDTRPSMLSIHHSMPHMGLNPVPKHCTLGNRSGFFLFRPKKTNVIDLNDCDLDDSIRQDSVRYTQKADRRHRPHIEDIENFI